MSIQFFKSGVVNLLFEKYCVCFFSRLRSSCFRRFVRAIPNFPSFVVLFNRRHFSNVTEAKWKMVLTLNGCATSERISSILIIASTWWSVIDHCTLCINSAGSFTRIDTSLIDASSIGWTFWIYCTLWTAIRWCSKVCWQTRTRWTLVNHFALWIWSAWCRYAWILRLNWCIVNLFIARCKWIACVTRCTATDRIMVDNVTFWKNWQ